MFKVSKTKKQKNSPEQRVKYINIIGTRTMSGAFIVSFEHTSHIIILLLLLNSNK